MVLCILILKLNVVYFSDKESVAAALPHTQGPSSSGPESAAEDAHAPASKVRKSNKAAASRKATAVGPVGAGVDAAPAAAASDAQPGASSEGANSNKKSNKPAAARKAIKAIAVEPGGKSNKATTALNAITVEAVDDDRVEVLSDSRTDSAPKPPSKKQIGTCSFGVGVVMLIPAFVFNPAHSSVAPDAKTTAVARAKKSKQSPADKASNE